MVVTEVTSEGWFTRIKNAIAGVIFGIVLFVVAVGGLFWNEGRAVRRMQQIGVLDERTISIPADSVNPANETKWVQASATATTEDILTDPVFKVSDTAIKLIRTVEMYQWEEKKKRETRKKLGGGKETVTTYSYRKDWSPRRIDSSRFKESGHDNPATMAYQGETQQARDVGFGAFKLSPALIGKMDQAEPLPLKPAEVEEHLPEGIRTKAKVSASEIYVRAEPDAGGDAHTPRIGDLRIRWKVVNPAMVSIIAAQKGDTFAPVQYDDGGSELQLRYGKLTKAEMIAQTRNEANMLTWIIRGVGTFCVILGIFLVFKPIAVVADVVPILGSLLGAGLFAFALLLGLGISFIAMSLGWIFYRPLIGIPLLILGVGGIVALIVVATRARAAK